MSRSSQIVAAAIAWTVFVTLALSWVILGDTQTPLPGLPYPGPLVTRGLPVFDVIAQVCAMATVGFLMVAVFLLPNSGKLEGLSVQSVRLASRFAWVWLVGSIIILLATVADINGLPMWNVSPAQVWYFLVEFSQGKALAIQIGLVLVVATWTSWSLNPIHAAISFGLAIGAIAPVALTGHSASSGPHMLAISSLLLHLVAAIMWVGGLIGLTWVGLRGSKRLDAGLVRYSALATWCFIIIAISGVVSGLVRITQFDYLFSQYGFMLSLKASALIVLGLFGYAQRKRLVNNGQGFVKIALLELFVMVSTVAIAAVLSRTPLPGGEEVYVGQAEVLLSGPMPPEPTWARVLWGWEPNGFGMLVVGLGSVLYGYGVVKLRKRGDAWSWGRTLSWFFGLLIIAWATFGGLGAYSSVMFSLHMISHMMLAMIAPIFLVLGAPMTLALRTLPGPRVPGEISPRKLLNDFLHSGVSKFYTHPAVAGSIFIGSLFAVYFTDIFTFLMMNHIGHAFMEFHFLLSGFLFYYVVVGVDPSPRQLPPIMRMLVLMVALPFHAFFSVALMSSFLIVGEDYFTLLERPYARDLLADQHFGASVSWAMGEIPMLIVVLAIFAQWVKSDMREARRKDRAADRDNDADLEKYNEYLKALSKKNNSQPRS